MSSFLLRVESPTGPSLRRACPDPAPGKELPELPRSGLRTRPPQPTPRPQASRPSRRLPSLFACNKTRGPAYLASRRVASPPPPPRRSPATRPPRRSSGRRPLPLLLPLPRGSPRRGARTAATTMAATADPRAKPPPAASHHLKPWAPPAPPRGHRVPSLPAVAEGGGARDRRRSSSSHRRGVAGDGTVVEEPPSDGRMEDLRAKLMGHLRDAADRLCLPPPKPKPQPRSPEAPSAPQPTPAQQEAATAARPWNLRDRKCRRPTARGAAAALDASPAWEPAAEKERRAGPDERAPFAVALTAEEVEEDVYALTGARPRRRPRKRPRVVQRQLDSLFPGLWLTEITADAYKVPDE